MEAVALFKHFENIEKLQEKARKLRVDVLETTSQAGSGHSGGSLSSVEIITAVWKA